MHEQPVPALITNRLVHIAAEPTDRTRNGDSHHESGSSRSGVDSDDLGFTSRVGVSG